MRPKQQIAILLLFLSLIFSCNPPAPSVKTGTWRGVLEIQGEQLPFTFDLEKQGETYVAKIRNAQELLVLDEITVTADSIHMNVHVFDAVFKAAFSDTEMNGEFIINYADNYRLPFHAYYGQDYRFVPSEASTAVDFSGKYAVQFFNENNTVDALGMITQDGNRVEGTFLTPTGDYRYLEGNVVNDTLWLSAFDGNHIFLFNATKSGDTLTGTHWLGRSRKRAWMGIKNELAEPPSSSSLTFMKEGYEKLEFTFPDETNQLISLQDERFRGKVVVVQILGSWCPNCMDETRFLSEWYPKNKDRGVEIIGLAYEQKADFAYASGRVKKMKEKLNVPYTILIAGTNTNASETLPALNKVIGFPTTIFVGKDGKVKYIHTGFSGPGTGAYYIEQQERFNETVNQLLTSF